MKLGSYLMLMIEYFLNRCNELERLRNVALFIISHEQTQSNSFREVFVVVCIASDGYALLLKLTTVFVLPCNLSKSL